jgi:hypothetical protein
MTADGQQWWRFWADVVIFTQYTEEIWYERISKIMTPCNDLWPMVYVRRYPVANDNAPR